MPHLLQSCLLMSSFILFSEFIITGHSPLLIMIALQLNHRPASASFPVVLQIVHQCCFESSASAVRYLFHLVTLLLVFSLSSLLSFNPSAFCPCFSNIVYLQLTTVSTSELAPHRFAFLHHIGSGCGYSCCPSPQFA